MNVTKLPLTLIILLILVAALVFPSAVFASGAGETLEAEVKGYHVSLSFVDEVETGQNEVHVQVVHSEDRSVRPTKVEISIMPLEEAGHQATESDNAHGTELAAEHATNSTSGHAAAPSGHENSTGMNADSESLPETGHELESGSHEKMSIVTLEPEIENGAYKGVLNFESSGNWNLVVHFIVEGEVLEVEFPVSVAGVISRYSVLAGILGLNIAIVSTAAVLKRKAGKKSL